MDWQICIRYPNGQEKAICTYHSREVALKQIDAIYAHGYPLHVAYVVRPLSRPIAITPAPNGCLQFA